MDINHFSLLFCIMTRLFRFWIVGFGKKSFDAAIYILTFITIYQHV